MTDFWVECPIPHISKAERSVSGSQMYIFLNSSKNRSGGPTEHFYEKVSLCSCHRRDYPGPAAVRVPILRVTCRDTLRLKLGSDLRPWYLERDFHPVNYSCRSRPVAGLRKKSRRGQRVPFIDGFIDGIAC